MAVSFVLPRSPPLLPPLTPTTHRPLLSSSSSFQSRLRALLLPEVIAATRSNSSCSTFTATFLPFASHIVICPAVHAGRDPRRSWKASFSGRPAPPLTSSEAEELPPSSSPVHPPALPFRGGDLLRGAWSGFWLQLWIAVLSRALLWAIRRPYAPGFPGPVVAAWVLLGLSRAMSSDATQGLVPLGRLVAGVTGRPDLGPVALSTAAAALLLLAVGSFLAMDRLAAWAVSEVARRNLTPDAAIVAFSAWSVWVLAGAGKGGARADRGRGASRWWELAMCVVWVHLCVLCLCLPHNLVKHCLLVVLEERPNIS